jgi:hypothetical protein
MTTPSASGKLPAWWHRWKPSESVCETGLTRPASSSAASSCCSWSTAWSSPMPMSRSVTPCLPALRASTSAFVICGKTTSSCHLWTNQRTICNGCCAVSVQSRVRVEALAGIAQQDPADRNDRLSGVAPSGRAGADLHDPVALTIPAGHAHPLPAGGLVGQHLGQVRQARSPGPWTPDRPGSARRGWPVEGGVEPQPGDAGHAPPGQRGQEFEGGEAAVRHEDQRPIGQPAPGLQDKLSPPVGELLVPSSLFTTYRSEGASTVRNGKAQTRPAQGMGTSSIRLSQRRPEALTKWPWLERTGSR